MLYFSFYTVSHTPLSKPHSSEDTLTQFSEQEMHPLAFHSLDRSACGGQSTISVHMVFGQLENLDSHEVVGEWLRAVFFQPFSFHDTYTLMTKVLRDTKK